MGHDAGLPHPVTPLSTGRRDLLVTVLAWLALGAWDASGLDLPAARLFGSAQGFALRERWFMSTLLHQGGRVAAFGFFGMHFLWRNHSDQRARAWLGAVLVSGLVFGLAQLARGAHYPGHTLWSAWAGWALCAGASRLPWFQSVSAKPSTSAAGVVTDPSLRAP